MHLRSWHILESLWLVAYSHRFDSYISARYLAPSVTLTLPV